MISTRILWKPMVSEGDPLAVDSPDRFILKMQNAFPRPWPIILTEKDLERLLGMAYGNEMVGNPFLKLVEQLHRYKSIVVWPEYPEDFSA